MASKKVNVKLHNILNKSTGDDSGDQLEIYGRFDVARLAFSPDIGEVVTHSSVNLFDRSSDDTQQLEEGTALIVETSAQLEIFPGEFLQITGHLVEEDDGFGGSDDGLGSRDIRIKFDDLASGLVELGDFHESDQIVAVKMSLTVM
jgi:hypothetical protein